MSRAQRQAGALLLGNFVLCAIFTQASHSLAAWQLRLWPGGLLVATAALQAGFGAGATAVFVTGLALDAMVPVPFGAQALVLLAGHAVLFSLRGRLVRDALPVRLAVTWLAGAGTLVAFALAEAVGGSGPAGVGRWLADLGATLAVTGLVAPWFFALQGRLLTLAQAGLRAGERWLD